MNVIRRSDLKFVEAVGELNYTNPFLEERIELERVALGSSFIAEAMPYWSFTLDQAVQRRGNLIQIMDRAVPIAQGIRERLRDKQEATEKEIALYDDLVIYILFYEQLEDWSKREPGFLFDESANLRSWKQYSSSFDYWFHVAGISFPSRNQKTHMFAMLHQVFRAFFNIFEGVIGESRPAAKLRARIWQSIFTHDMRRFRRSLHESLHQVTTLVMGPSGSGKELVARAIGLSRYVPFDAKLTAFKSDPSDSYYAINVSAFAKNLVESELFGHAKGAFTDANNARVGWLETCGEYGSVLLDEIGELDLGTQVKLLRVLQNRQYQRLGESKMRVFSGKLIAATNRDLRKEIDSGAFREDLYYRLCADVIETPSLAEQLSDNSAALDSLILYICKRIAPEEHENIAEDVRNWIRDAMPQGYSWPGNIRELEQCVRNIMIHGEYKIAGGQRSRQGADSIESELVGKLTNLELTADELVQLYCRIAYRKTKSFEKSAKLLQLDRRTVRAKVDMVTDNES